MHVKIVSNVINNITFIKHYNELITDFEKDALHPFVKLLKDSSIIIEDKRLIKHIAIESGKSYPLLPILNKENTTILAEELKDIARKFALDSKPIIKKIRETVKDDNVTHNILGHIALANLLQQTYSARVNNPYGGSVLVLENPEECKVIFSEIVSISSNQLVVYWQNSLQENNFVYTNLFENKNSIKMLKSRENNGCILPYGAMEEHFIRLKLATAKRLNGSHISTFFCNLPILDIRVIKDTRNELIDLVKLSDKYFTKLTDKIISSKEIVFENHKHLDSCHMLQAGYYVWCYVIYKEWIDNGFLNKLEAVKNVFGVHKIV